MATFELGYALSSEEHDPHHLVRWAQRAETAGFTFALISDHYHPGSDADARCVGHQWWPTMRSRRQSRLGGALHEKSRSSRLRPECTRGHLVLRRSGGAATQPSRGIRPGD